MPQVNLALDLPWAVPVLFDFLARPANLVQLAPVEVRLQLVAAPERLHLGAVLHWKARRMGMSQSLVNEVTAFEEGLLIEERQQRGPFKSWRFVHRFAPSDAGTRLTEELTYEPPGGMLGLLVSADAVHRELEQLFAFRAEQLRTLIAG